MTMLRVVIFCVIGLAVSEIMQALGSDQSLFVFNFVFGGLGAVAAVDVFLWLMRRRSTEERH